MKMSLNIWVEKEYGIYGMEQFLNIGMELGIIKTLEERKEMNKKLLDEYKNYLKQQ